MVGLGLTGMKVSADFTESMREAREVSQASSAETAWIKSFNELEEEFAADREYKTYKTRFDKRKAEIWTDISSQITEPGALSYARRHFDRETATREHTVNRMSRVVEIDAMKRDFVVNLNDATKRGDYPMIDKLIAGAVASRVITAEEGADEKIKAVKDSEVYRASALIMQDPEAAIEQINDVEQFPNIDEKTRYEMVRRAEIEMIRQDRIKKRDMEKRYDETDKKFLVSLTKDELTREQVMGAIRNDALDPTDGRFYLKALEKTGDGKTDPDVFVQHRVDISDGVKNWKTLQTELKESYAAGDLVKEDFDKLLTKIDSIRKGDVPIKDAYYKRAADYLESQIKPSRGMLLGESSEDSHDLMMATLELDRRLDEAKAAGKPIIGNDIVKLAAEIAPNFKATMAERMQRTKAMYERENGKVHDDTKAIDEAYRKTAIRILESRNKIVNGKTINTVIKRLKELDAEGE